MDKVTVSAPNVMLECRATTVGGFPSETCYWTLRLNEGDELWWPMKGSEGPSGYPT